MTPPDINGLLRSRAAEYTTYLIEQGTPEGDFWRNEAFEVQVKGIGKGKWRKVGAEEWNRDMIALAMEVHGWTREEASEDAAMWLEAGKLVTAAMPLAASSEPASFEREKSNLASVIPEEEPSNFVPINGANGNHSHEPEEIRQPAPRVSYLPDYHRPLPSSDDAEKGLIASFFLDPAKVGPLCQEQCINEGWFAHPGNAVIFGEILFMWGERMPCDFVTITASLKSAGKLDSVGGAAFVTGLISYIPTAKNAEFYAEILKEQYSRRETIRIATSAATKAYDPLEDWVKTVEDLRRLATDIAERRENQGRQRLLAPRKYQIAKPPPEPVPVFKLRDVSIATQGNVVAIQAKIKVGKSGLITGLIGCTFGQHGDTLGFSSANPRGHAVIHFDTEQSPWDHYQGITCALQRRAHQAAEPPWLRSYSVADLTYKTRRDLIRQEMQEAASVHGGIHVVIIDGVGDLVPSVNDEEASIALVAELHMLAIFYNTVIVCVLHENPGSEIGKTRGHLGSQLERKAETNLRLEKDDQGVTVVYSDRARHAHIPKARGARFKWSDDHGMHVTTDDPFTESRRRPSARAKQEGVRCNDGLEAAKLKLGKFFAQSATAKRANLIEIGKIAGTTLDRWLEELVRAKLIVKEKFGAGLYSATKTWKSELDAEFPEDEEEN